MAYGQKLSHIIALEECEVYFFLKNNKAFALA